MARPRFTRRRDGAMRTTVRIAHHPTFDVYVAALTYMGLVATGFSDDATAVYEAARKISDRDLIEQVRADYLLNGECPVDWDHSVDPYATEPLLRERWGMAPG